MKIELLYFLGCPHVAEARAAIRESLSGLGLSAEIQDVLVEDVDSAAKLRFSGSPSIRVNGCDVGGGPVCGEYAALCCRVYPGSVSRGIPPAALISTAIRQAWSQEAQ
jgi:hypothetical protein